MESGDNFLSIIFFCVFVLAAGMFIIENPNLFGIRQVEENNDSEEEQTSTSPLGAIFYLYNHQSEKQWLKWINQQNLPIRNKAVDMLIEHLNDKPKNWGFVTLEAIECLKGFKDLGSKSIDNFLAAYIKKTGKIWNDYKSIPNYYQKSGEVLSKVNPDLALEVFIEEIGKRNNNQVSLEKKRIITDVLPNLNEKAIDLMIDLLSSTYETFGTRSHALRVCDKFSKQAKDEIYLESLKRIQSKYKENFAQIRTEESHFIQDLIEECVKKIAEPGFYEIIKISSQTPKLQKFVLNPLIKSINSGLKDFSSVELLAISKLNDNEHHDLRRALARRNQLEPGEINNIITQAYEMTTNLEDLLNAETEDLDLPIPAIFQEKYEDFQTLFFKNIEEHEYVTSEKIFGGLLMTGDERISKLYFSRALAKEKKWNFDYLDAAALIDKNIYQRAVDQFSSLRKPYLLYILNPDALYSKYKMEVDTLRAKYIQTLSIQTLDTKSFLAGDILIPMEKTKNTSLSDHIRSLRSKFFPQMVDINQFPEETKNKILDFYMKHISSHRFTNRSELVTELLNTGKNMHVIEFCGFVVEQLSTMLLVYGHDVKLEEIKNLNKKLLEEQKADTNNDDEDFSVKVSESEPELEVEETEEVKLLESE